MKDFILELKTEDKDMSSKAMFYRYRYKDTLIWFSQNEKGYIYSVGVEKENKPSYIEMSIFCDFNNYYPTEFIMKLCGVRINSKEQYNKYLQDLQCVMETLSEIKKFFEESEHAELYKKYNER